MGKFNDCAMGKQCSRNLEPSLTFWIISLGSQGIRVSPDFQVGKTYLGSGLVGCAGNLKLQRARLC